MLRDYQRTGESAQWDEHEVQTFLTGRGFFIGPAGIGTALATDDPTTVLVKVDLDANVPQEAIDAALDAFVPTVDPVKTAQVNMRKAYAEIKDNVASNGKTPIEDRVAALERAVLAFGVTLGVG